MKTKNRKRKIFKKLCILVVSFVLLFYFLQRFWAHREKEFYPDYPKEHLTEESDYDTFFLQTGLGESAIDKLLSKNDFQSILNAQEKFFYPGEVSCEPLLGWFTREDRLSIAEDEESDAEKDKKDLLPQLVDLQPGDIILTLSTHSAGWRHGHAALVLDESTTLESMVWGTNSDYGQIENWRSYSNFAVLRVKNITPELQQQVKEYACNSLYDVPYHLSAGFIGTKAPEPEDPQFGVQCAYLVWYAWNHFGYDLDSDGGCLVTANDILHSDLLEIVQIYGMNPKNYGECNRPIKNKYISESE